MKYIKLLRLHHWIKNILIFIPIIFNGDFFNAGLLQKTCLGWFIYGIMASSVYIFNDIKDVEKDRQHPVKCRRPLASGEVKMIPAYVMCASGFFISISLSFFIFSWKAAGLCFLYIIMNMLYSWWLKNVELIDVTILAFGYIIRIIYGGIICGLAISSWVLLTTLAGSYWLGFGKREKELQQHGNAGRRVLNRYPSRFLEKCTQVFLGMTIIFYSLSCADKAIAASRKGLDISWTVPIVILICLRYSFLLEGKESSGDPVDVVLGDHFLLMLVAMYGIAVILRISL